MDANRYVSMHPTVSQQRTPYSIGGHGHCMDQITRFIKQSCLAEESSSGFITSFIIAFKQRQPSAARHACRHDDRMPRKEITSGTKCSASISFSKLRKCSASPYYEYPNIMEFQETRSLQAMLSNMDWASSILPHFAYIDISAFETCTHKLKPILSSRP
jgi:hypothetical protein